MSGNTVVRASDSNGFMSAIGSIFAEFTAETDAEVKADIESAGRVTRSHVRANSPKSSGENSGRYARSWGLVTSSHDGHHMAVIKNEKHWQLTHLLEDGHDSYNQYGGSYGHVDPAQPEHHVQRAYEVGKAELERLLGVKL